MLPHSVLLLFREHQRFNFFHVFAKTATTTNSNNNHHDHHHHGNHKNDEARKRQYLIIITASRNGARPLLLLLCCYEVAAGCVYLLPFAAVFLHANAAQDFADWGRAVAVPLPILQECGSSRLLRRPKHPKLKVSISALRPAVPPAPQTCADLRSK